MRFVLEFDGTRIGVYVCSFETSALAILADVGLVGTLDPTEMLQLNGMLATEALAIVNDTIVVRAVVDVALPIEEIERRIQLAACVGAMIKRGLHRPQPPPLFFSHYGD